MSSSFKQQAEAFAAILADGSVVTWGEPRDLVVTALKSKISSKVSSSFKQLTLGICCDPGRWVSRDLGLNQCCGGDSSKVQNQLKGVQQVQATKSIFFSAFAAILADGSVVTWGVSRLWW